jgi:hypothetical protein
LSICRLSVDQCSAIESNEATGRPVSLKFTQSFGSSSQVARASVLGSARRR